MTSDHPEPGRRRGTRIALYVLIGLIGSAAGGWYGWHQQQVASSSNNSGQTPTDASAGVGGPDGASTLSGASPTTKPGPVDAKTVSTVMALQLPDAKGATVALSSFAGRTLVLNFWATWCPPCLDEMPELSSLQSELNPATVQILGIGIDSAAKIAEFADKQQMTYPLLVAGSSGLELVRLLGNPVGGLPFTVVINPKGEVVEQISGRVDVQALRARLTGKSPGSG